MGLAANLTAFSPSGRYDGTDLRSRTLPLALLLAASLPAQIPSAHRALLNTYCVTCHNSKTKIAGLTLDTADLSKAPANAELWEKVIRKLRTGAMPPLG